jgi:hypothetical protein
MVEDMRISRLMSLLVTSDSAVLNSTYTIYI